MSAFILKIIALLSMIIDHLVKSGLFSQKLYMDCFHLSIKSSYILLQSTEFIGRLAFPIFGFLIAEGCKHTRNIKKYILRLLMFGLISEIPFDLALDPINQMSSDLWKMRITPFGHMNIFLTLALGACAIYGYEIIKHRHKSTAAALIPIVILAVIGGMVDVDYSWFGVLFIVSAYLPKHKWTRTVAMASVLSALYLGYASFWFQSFSNENIISFSGVIASLGLIALYNNQRGPELKWLFYCAYPMHLVLLFTIRVFLYS